MNIVFLSIHYERSTRAFPLASAMLAASLKKEYGHKVHTELLEFYIDDDNAQIIKTILERKPDILVFSIYLWNRKKFIELALKLKSNHKDIIIAAGGPEVTADLKYFQSNDCFDLSAAGEGELIIIKIIKSVLQKKEINIIRKEISTKVADNLNKLPSPFTNKIIDFKKYTGVMWELSRGCPFKCDFCYESMGTESVRRYSFKRIKKELGIIVKSGIKQVFVLDPTFNFNKDFAKKVLDLIKKKASDINFYFEIRSEFIDEELAEKFSKINCSLQIGLQSSVPEVLRNVNRSIKKENFSNNVLYLHQRSIVYGFDLIYGLPGDSLEGFKESMDFCMSMVPNHLDIFPLSVLPGTRLYEKAEMLKLNYLKTDPYHVLSQESFLKEDMEKASEIAEACNIFYNNGRAVPWFDIILDFLEIKSSIFFDKLSVWIKKNSINDVLILQKSFITELFNEKNKQNYIDIVHDIMTYFWYYSYLSEDEKIIEITEKKYILNPDSVVVDFTYDPVELINNLDSGTTDLDELIFYTNKNKGKYIYYLFKNMFALHKLSETEILKLEKFKKLPVSEFRKIDYKNEIKHGLIIKKPGKSGLY